MQLIERHLPRWQFGETHERFVPATPPRVLDAITRPEVFDDPVARGLIALRELPGRLAGRLSLRGAARAGPAFGLADFTYLGRDGDREIAFGLAGRFWRTDYGLIPVPNADAFEALPATGIAKLVLNFTTAPDGEGTRLATHTRIGCGDAATERSLRPYWLLIRPASGLIRRRLLARVHQAAMRVS